MDFHPQQTTTTQRHRQHATSDASASRLAPAARRYPAELRDAMFPARDSELQLLDSQSRHGPHRSFQHHQPHFTAASFAPTPAPFDYTTMHTRGTSTTSHSYSFNSTTDANVHSSSPTSELTHHSTVYPLTHDAGPPWAEDMSSYAPVTTPAVAPPAPASVSVSDSVTGVASSAPLYQLPHYQQQQAFHSLAGPRCDSVSLFATTVEDDSNDAKLLREVLQGPPRQHAHQFAYPQQQQSYHDPTQSPFGSSMNSFYSTPTQSPLASASTLPFDKMGIYMSPTALAQVRSATVSMSSSIGGVASGSVSPAGSSVSAASESTVDTSIGVGMMTMGLRRSSDMDLMGLTHVRTNSVASSTPSSASRSSSTAPKKTPASRICRFPGCAKGIRSRGLCKGHGGGRRCTTPGCEISDQGGGHCIAHGGGKRCHVAGCIKSAQSKGLCKLHGGARRCKVANCVKNCQVKGLCRLHYSIASGASASPMVASPSPSDRNTSNHHSNGARRTTLGSEEETSGLLHPSMSFSFA